MTALVATTKATAAANLESFNIMSPVLFLRQFGRNRVEFVPAPRQDEFINYSLINEY
jgi:hypothetical protein